MTMPGREIIQSGRGSFRGSPFPGRVLLIPIPYSLFPIPYFLFPIPYFLFPIH